MIFGFLQQAEKWISLTQEVNKFERVRNSWNSGFQWLKVTFSNIFNKIKDLLTGKANREFWPF